MHDQIRVCHELNFQSMQPSLFDGLRVNPVMGLIESVIGSSMRKKTSETKNLLDQLDVFRFHILLDFVSTKNL